MPSLFILLITICHMSSWSFCFNSASTAHYLFTKEKYFSVPFDRVTHMPHHQLPEACPKAAEHSASTAALWPRSACSAEITCPGTGLDFDFGRTSGSEKPGLLLGLGLEFETQQIILLTLLLFANFMKFKKSFLGNSTNLFAKSWDGPRKMESAFGISLP